MISRKGRLLSLLLLVLLLSFAFASAAWADDGTGGSIAGEDLAIEPSQASLAKAKLDLTGAEALLAEMQAQAGEAYGVGDDRTFLILDDTFGRYRLSAFTVKYIGNNVEVWVQKDLRYRNPDLTINPIHPEADHPQYVTQERMEYLADVFEDVVRPTDVDFYGPYADRDGSQAVLPELVGLPADYYATDNPQRLIILISNVRDDNYYDPINNPTRILGFVSSTLNLYADRNIFTLDSSRWNIWMGAPRYLYESTLAHEFQHLIATDSPGGFQEIWLEEGLAEFAEFLNGYRPTPEEWRTQFFDYPENSLVVWDEVSDPEQGGVEVTADYHHSNMFLHYLAGRLQDAGLGTGADGFLRLVTGLQNIETTGKDAVNEMLAAAGAPFDFDQVWGDFRADVLHGGDSNSVSWGDYITAYTSPSGVPIAPIDFGRIRRNYNREGYDMPGAPPYGSDYVQIGWSEAVSATTQLTFEGSQEPLAVPSSWQVIDSADINLPAGAEASGNVLYSDHHDLNDDFLILPVTVPAEGAMLEFDTLYDIEAAWDFGFVQVTTDTVTGTGFTSLALEGMSTETDPAAHPVLVANVPGFSGVSGGDDGPAWVHVSHDLGAYAGQSILLAFRYGTDWGTAGNGTDIAPGWYLDNLMLGAEALYTDEADLPAAALSIWDVRGYGNGFKVDVVTFEDGNGPNVTGVQGISVADDLTASIDLGSFLDNPGFDEAGESVMVLVSAIPPTITDLVNGTPAVYTPYQLTGVPATIYSSRTRVTGTAFGSTQTGPTVYPADVYTVTVNVDNLGYNGDIVADAGQAYVAVPLPAGLSYVEDSAFATTASENVTFTVDLQAIDAGLPAGPGLYWHGMVTTSDSVGLAFQVAAPNDVCLLGSVPTAEQCPEAAISRPMAYIANGMFGDNPSQHLTSLPSDHLPANRGDEYARIVSPLELSVVQAPATAAEGAVASYVFTFLNTDDALRSADFSFDIPSGSTLVGLSVNHEEVLTPQASATGMRFPMSLDVPSTIKTGLSTVVGVDLMIGSEFEGRDLNIMPTVLQPESEFIWDDLASANVPVTRLPKTVVLPLTYDGWVNGGVGGANYNGFAALIARATGLDNVLLTFDRSALPDGADVQSASLSLVFRGQSGSTGKSLTAWNANAYDPMTVTYDTAPQTYNPGAPVAVPAAPGAVSFDVKAQVMAWDAADDMGRLALSASGPLGRVIFDSLESYQAVPAALEVTYLP